MERVEESVGLPHRRPRVRCATLGFGLKPTTILQQSPLSSSIGWFRRFVVELRAGIDEEPGNQGQVW